MRLKAGDRLDRFEIVEPLGEGAYAETYKARDTRLDRTVAIKVLPEHLSQKPQLRERFEREARAVSSLNHSNICTLHDVGQQDDVDYLVMEYVPGLSLQERLDRGELCAYVAKAQSVLSLFVLACRCMLGAFDLRRDLRIIKADSADVSARRKRLLVAIDGEVETMRAPLHYRSRPGALRVFAPA